MNWGEIWIVIESFIDILANIVKTFWEVFTWELDLGPLGTYSLLLLFSTTAIVGFFIYKFVRWII